VDLRKQNGTVQYIIERIIALRGDHEIWAEKISLTEPLNIETQSQESRIFL
jgi:hypothetical protein